MKKVIFAGNDVCLAETGKKVGEIRPSNDGCIDVYLNNGVHVYALYGAIDEDGKFYTFCRNTEACGRTCRNTKAKSCRYNREMTDRRGYYADVDATKSVW